MEANTTTGAPPRAGRREWIGLAVLALPTLLLALDLSVTFLAIPRLSEDLGASSVQQLWITDIYGFMVAGFLVTMGTLGDRIGRRRLLMIGGVAFGAASTLAAFSVSAPMLVIARAIMGVAGATLAPSTLALISNMFRDRRQFTRAISIWVSCFMGGAALGPVVSGALLEHFWWGSVFLIAVPVLIVMLIAAPLLLPEYRDSAAGRLDLTSVALSLLAILPIIYGVKELARNGAQLVPLASLVVGLAFAVVFVRRQKRLSSPLLDIRLFGNRSIGTTLVILMFSGSTQSGVMFLVTLYLQMVAKQPPLAAGLWMMPSSLAMVAGSLIAPALARMLRPGLVVAVSLAVAAVGYLLLVFVDDAAGLVLLVAGTVVFFLGIGPVSALSNDLVISSAPPEKAGSAASLSQTSSDFGIALGVAVFGTIGTAVYRDQLTGAIPAGVPAAAAQTAHESIAGAVQVASTLPARVGAQLLDVARATFMTGLHAAALVSAILVLLLGVLGALVLRQPKHGTTTEDVPPEDEDVAVAADRSTPSADRPARVSTVRGVSR